MLESKLIYVSKGAQITATLVTCNSTDTYVIIKYTTRYVHGFVVFCFVVVLSWVHGNESRDLLTINIGAPFTNMV